MVSILNKNKMMDYLVSRLEGQYDQVEPKTRWSSIDLNQNIDINHILLSDVGVIHGIVLLLDKEFPEHSFEHVYNSILKDKIHNPYMDLCAIFYKDRKTFFRNPDKEEQKILEPFQDIIDIKSIIKFRPEEQFLYKPTESKIIHYYQPDTEGEGIINVKFEDIPNKWAGKRFMVGKDRDKEMVISPYKVYEKIHTVQSIERIPDPFILKDFSIEPYKNIENK